MSRANKMLSEDQVVAIHAVRDFMAWKVPGYNVELIHAIENAKDAAEVRALLRKARAAS